MAVPTVLCRRVGPGQHPTRSLHRIPPRMQQLAHMARMILDAELLLDYPSDHRRGPDPVVQTVSHWTAVQYVPHLLLLRVRQGGGTARPVAFQQTLDTLGLIALQPRRDLGARRLQQVRQLTAAMSLGIQHHRSQALRDSVGTIFLGFFTETDQSLRGAWM